MINQSQEDWDDSLIMKVFHDSIKRHKTIGKRTEQEDNSEPIKIPSINSSKYLKRKQQVDSTERDESSCQKKVKFESTEAAEQFHSERISSSGDNINQDSVPNSFTNTYPTPQYFLPTYITKELLDEAQQAMLMAWYQSGYATGRYQILCELAEQGYNVAPCQADGSAST